MHQTSAIDFRRRPTESTQSSEQSPLRPIITNVRRIIKHKNSNTMTVDLPELKNTNNSIRRKNFRKENSRNLIEEINGGRFCDELAPICSAEEELFVLPSIDSASEKPSSAGSTRSFLRNKQQNVETEWLHNFTKPDKVYRKRSIITDDNTDIISKIYHSKNSSSPQNGKVFGVKLPALN